ncbi:hypothetical protein AC579_121 [Pseudocercospora musae]|uniref:Carrier domain-containing protein n=1 Tax=Pseudocercospora musae TaxID=113226 RepID=A0A139IM33_9PEZI|nr:hypothetical protein AC579_121 [Pseudocercospora musae]
MVNQPESTTSVAGFSKQAMARHDSATSTWKTLPVSLSYAQGGGWEDLEEVVELGWLLLLFTYEGDIQPSCWLRHQGEIVCSKLLFASIHRSLALQDHKVQIRELAIESPEPHANANTVIAQGSLLEAQDWASSSDAAAGSGQIGFVLVLDSDDNSVHLCFKQNQPKVQEADVIGRIETLTTILSVLLESPKTLIGDAEFLSDYDKRRIIEWNRPMPDLPLDLTISSAFAAKAKESPNAPAICAWDGEMTYKDLDAASADIASLLSTSVRSETGAMVLFMMKKSKWALTAALAILRSGKAIVPLDPDWPKVRLDQIVELTGASVAICDQYTKAMLDPDSMTVVIVPAAAVSLANQHSLDSSCTSKDLAFVLFSSGSTGVPKGMLREHGTACTGAYAHARAMHLDSSSRVLQFANHVFDVAMLDFFTTLLMGGCVCIPSDFDRKNDLAGFIHRSQANWALLTPTVADLLDPSAAQSLRFVTLGGECVKAATVQKWRQVCRVGINYGSAEVDVTHVRDVFEGTNPSNVGRRLPSCLAYIVDPDNPSNILPVGAVGELVIAGPTMARGYLNAPEKTAQVFLSTPKRWITQGLVEKGDAPVDRIYRMGDLCRQRCDGSLDFVGRKDFQVKVNSQKVELGDIESQLSQHPVVKLCAALYPTQGPYARRLVAVVQSQGESSHHSRHDRAAKKEASVLSFHSMIEFLSAKLPSFMLPSVLIRLKSMPYTPTMKIDRNRLKMWLMEDDLRGGSASETCHISTGLSGSTLSAGELQAIELSRMIADIVSGRKSSMWACVSGHDNRLVDIGIDSAQVMQLASKIRKGFGVRVPVEMLAHRDMTVRKLAALLGSMGSQLVDRELRATVKERVQCLKEQVAQVSRSVLGIVEPSASDRNISVPSSPKQRVLLTGATGYLGVAILQHLLTSDHVTSVVVLVRGEEPAQAIERVRHALAAAGGAPYDQEKLLAWPGDLSRARLGLHEESWNSFTIDDEERSDKARTKITTIIHCGAVVDWSKSYEQLRAANVDSTGQLLQLTLESPHIQRFVFISGGRYPDPDQDDHRDLETIYAETAESTGYAQSKFVAERVVDNVRRVSAVKSIYTVSPAYLIGSAELGLANQDDYLWRMVWAAVRARAYNSDEDKQWLFVAATDSVAERIVTMASQNHGHRMDAHSKILDGLSVHEFWNIVRDVLKVPLTPVSADIWLQKVKCDMEETGDHLLWPLANTLDASKGQLTNCRCLTADMEVRAASRPDGRAVRKNLEYLSSVGFFA